MLFYRFYGLFLLLAFSFVASAQDSPKRNPVQWEFSVKNSSPGKYQLQFTAIIEPTWAIYSQHLESDAGPIPTSFEFEANANVQFLGKVLEQGEKIEVYDDIFEMKVAKYKKKVVFVQEIEAKAKTTVQGFVTFMTCDDKTCLPPVDVPFIFDLP
jgi:thiol:disulfide interchange protein DsbD